MSDSRSPQYKRGSSQDHEQYSKGKSLDGIRPITKTDDANPHAWKNTSSLHIEDENPR